MTTMTAGNYLRSYLTPICGWDGQAYLATYENHWFLWVKFQINMNKEL